MSSGEVRGFLERHGLLARRDLGQNFLCDDALAERLAMLSGIEPGDSVIEIGTGLGVLTRALAATANRVVTLEVDSGIVRALRAEDALPANVELIHEDALRADLAGLASRCTPPVRLVANLPYSISGPILRRLLDLRGRLADWSVMIQKEVADRVVAGPGSRTYGSLSVLHALCVETRKAMVLAPGCFFPVPKVRSTFLRMSPLSASPLEPGELPGVERVVRAAFSARRKTLVNALRGAGLAPDVAALERCLDALEIDRRVRAEALPPERLLALARALPGTAEAAT